MSVKLKKGKPPLAEQWISSSIIFSSFFYVNLNLRQRKMFKRKQKRKEKKRRVAKDEEKEE